MRNKTHLMSVAICLVIVLLGSGYVVAGTWTTLDYPGATATAANGISGNNIVGSYRDSSDWHSFLYDGTNWTTLPIIAYGIDGSNVVGGNQLYNITTQSLTTLDMPGAAYTEARGISGNKIVGWYSNSIGPQRSFLYDGTNWTTLENNGNYEISVRGISGNNIVGNYNQDVSGYVHGFLYDGTSWITLDKPGASQTSIRGIDGSNLVGSYGDGSDYRGFLYNGTTWTNLDAPGARSTYIEGISGNNLVGYYTDASWNPHGFIYTIPEPATLLLLGLGAAIIRKFRN